MSVQIHYPEVFDGSSGTDKRILMIRHRTSLIFEQGLDWSFGVVGHEDKRQTAEGPTQV
jgi:hypothetical protein